MISPDHMLRVKHVCLIGCQSHLHWPKNITLTDLFVLRDLVREARLAAAQELILLITIPSGVLFETNPVGQMFAERISVLLAGECRNVFIVIEDRALRDQTNNCIAGSSESLVRSGRVLVIDSLDEAFRRARPLAAREVLEMQRIVNRQSRPPACELHDDIPPTSSGTVPISRRPSAIELSERSEDNLSSARGQHR